MKFDNLPMKDRNYRNVSDFDIKCLEKAYDD